MHVSAEMTIIGKKADQCTAASIAFYSNVTAGNLSSDSFLFAC